MSEKKDRRPNMIPGLELARGIIGAYGLQLNDPSLPARTRNVKIAAAEAIEALILAELAKHRGRGRRGNQS